MSVFAVFALRAVVSLAALATLAALPTGVRAQDARDVHIRIDAGAVRGDITPEMYGSCIEDVNHEIYGGLYDQKIFGESFEEPPPADKIVGWTAYGGDWRGEKGGATDAPLCAVRADWGAKLVRSAGASVFSDGSVESEVRFAEVGGVNAGLLVRVASPGVGADNFDGYEISLTPAGQLILGKHRHDWRPLANAKAPIVRGDWNRLRVLLDGPRIRIYVNDGTTPSIDFTDADRPLLSGTIALRTWGSEAAFRAVRVRPKGALPIALNFRVTPAPAVSGMWDAVQTGDAVAHFARRGDHAFNGDWYQQIEQGAGTGRVGVADRGLNRWGIAVAAHQTFAGRVYLRGKGGEGSATNPPTVTVALQNADGTHTYATQTLGGVTADWRRYPFTLTANAADPNARFAVWVEKPGTIDIDQAVLMGTGAERFHNLPVRADIANTMVAGGIRFLRYGGTMVNASGYRWKGMIGDRDRRPPYDGHWYPYSTNGFGIFDFLDFCEAAGIEAAFAINIEETAQDAADLADYLTAPITNVWGRRRAGDGHPAPYRVRYIEIGNEEVIGDGRDAGGYAHYADRFRVLAAAIHGRNPTLPLVCAAWWVPDSPSMKLVFDAVDGVATAWDLHVDSDAANAGTLVDTRLARMQSLFQKWNPETMLQCVVFEENGNRHDLQRALGHATTLGATRRHSDFVRADCPANCLQPWGQNDNGWDQGQIFFTASKVWAMPPGDAQQMAAQAALPLCVDCTATAADVRVLQNLDLLATRSADGKTCVLSVVNTGASPLSATVALDHFAGIAPHTSVVTLAGPLDAVNSPNGPPAVYPQAGTLDVQGGTLRATFPAYSYTILRFSR